MVGKHGARAFVRHRHAGASFTATATTTATAAAGRRVASFHRTVGTRVCATSSSGGSSGVDAVVAAIAAKGDEIRKLKADKAPKEAVAPAVDALLKLKKEYEALVGTPFDAPKEGKDDKPKAAVATAPAPAAPKAARQNDSPPVGLEDLRDVRLGKMKAMQVRSWPAWKRRECPSMLTSRHANRPPAGRRREPLRLHVRPNAQGS